LAERAEYWRRAFAAHAKGAREILEIGSFIGASAALFLTLLPKARIACVDPFTGDLHGGEVYNGDVATIEARFDATMAPFPGRVEKIVSRSVPALESLKQENRLYDIIYIDGSHVHDDILVDSLLAWPLLKTGGLMMWDDYRGGGTWARRERPRHAIETFLALHPEHRVVHARYQLFAVKTAAPRPLAARFATTLRALRG
jgi:predicted O-methyltransferase YrrM